MIYTTLGQSPHLYKPEATILNPILAENLILGGSIVVPGTQRHSALISTPDGALVASPESRLLVQGQQSDGSDPRLIQSKSQMMCVYVSIKLVI